MRPQEEEIVKRQRVEVEDTIGQEWEAWERKKRQQEGEGESGRGEDGGGLHNVNTNGTADSSRENTQRSEDRAPLNGRGDNPVDALPQARESEVSSSSMREDEKNASPSPARSRAGATRPAGPDSDRPPSSRDDDHGGEELELAQEDDVIY